MTKNKEIAEFMLSKIKEFGYEPYDIDYGNGYFVFGYGDDSVVLFRCKGVAKHWKFGMWIFSKYLDKQDEKEKNKYPFIQIFAQYDTQIDKFKPSRSSLCVNYNASDWNENKENNGLWLGDLKNMLGMIKRHPILCYCEFCGEYAGYYSRSFLWEYIKSESYIVRNKVKKAIKMIYLPYTKVKIFFAKRDKCVKSIELYDFEKENPGWSTDCLYQVRVVFAADSNDVKEVAWLDKWFKKDRYGKYDFYDYVIKLDLFRREGLDGWYSYAQKNEKSKD